MCNAGGALNGSAILGQDRMPVNDADSCTVWQKLGKTFLCEGIAFVAWVIFRLGPVRMTLM